MSWQAALAALTRDRMEGRRFIVVTTFARRADGWRETLRSFGADVIGAVAALGEADVAPLILVPPESGPGVLTYADTFLRALVDPPPLVRAFLDAIDPDRDAELIAGPWADLLGDRLADRRRFGSRDRAWGDLEDKTRIDPVLDALGVPRPPGRVVDPSEAPDVAARLDAGSGTVWAADGIHGGAFGLHWVRTPAQAEAAAVALAGCASVRVATFVPGTPCSVHGLVFADEVLVTGPMRILCFRRRDEGRDRILFAGVSSRLSTDRDALRRWARRTGEELRERVGYRGLFGLDGVLGPDGFVATELNPRISLGSEQAVAGLEGLHLALLGALACEDPALQGVPGLQDAVFAHLDAAPRQALLCHAPALQGPCGKREVEGVPLEVRRLGVDRIVTATLREAHGPDDVPRLLGEADRIFGLGLGHLDPL